MPTRSQRTACRRVVQWYMRLHYGAACDPGSAEMFTSRAHLGHFAVDRARVRAGDPQALFQLLIAVAMFQRRQDTQIMKILRGISRRDMSELTDPWRLLRLADDAGCPHLASSTALHGECDLTKVDGAGTCGQAPRIGCAPKRHTVMLKRYGDFGKLPTSAALMLREADARDLAHAFRSILNEVQGATARAVAMEALVCRVWHVHEKLAAMYLSLLTNPDPHLGFGTFSEGIDWRYFVAIDSNVTNFLQWISYGGAPTYSARRAFVRELSRRIELSEVNPRLRGTNPRVIQQALYLFASSTNRRALDADCSRLGASACRSCPRPLVSLCPLAQE